MYLWLIALPFLIAGAIFMFLANLGDRRKSVGYFALAVILLATGVILIAKCHQTKEVPKEQTTITLTCPKKQVFSFYCS